MRRALDVFGAGAFGTSLAIAYAQAGHQVTLWARDGAQTMARDRENKRRLPGFPFPENLVVTGDFSQLRADTILLAVPTQALDAALEAFTPKAKCVVSLSKGLHQKSGLFPTALVTKSCPDATVAQLTGPSFAKDIARGLPTALTLACTDGDIGRALQEDLHIPTIRPYLTRDVLGAEIGGALKNVYAIACGAAMGAGFGLSSRAALMTRGFAEMTAFAQASGARSETLTGLSGFGDLVLTCGSEMSRNYRFGQALGQSKHFTEGVTIEGAATAHAILTRSETGGAQMPIAQQVARMIDGTHGVTDAIDTLLRRRLRSE